MEFSTSRTIWKNCSVYAGRKAFHIREKDYSYKDFATRINAIVNLIHENPDGSGITAVLTNDDFDSYAALFACWYSGKAYLPLNAHAPVERNLLIIRESGIKTLLFACDPEEVRSYLQPGLKLLSTCNQPVNSKEPELHFPSGQDLAYVLYTSGSTGVPKGVPVSFTALDSFMEAFCHDYDINCDDRFLQIYDLGFDGAIPCYIAPLCFGSAVYTVPQGEVKYLKAYSLMKNHELSVIKMTPSVLHFLRPFFSEIRLEKVRYSIFGGEAFSSQLAGEWSSCVPNALIQNVYGPTETTVFCLRYEWRSGDFIHSKDGIVALGKGTGKCVFHLDYDQEMNPDQEESKAEICIGGPQVFAGYMGNKVKKDEEVFLFPDEGKGNKYYRSGDLVYRDREGMYFFSGRKDFQVQVQGFRVEPGEIENHAREFLRGENIAAFALPGTSGNMEIHLCIESEIKDFTKLSSYLADKLPVYMLPSNYHYFKKFPLSDSGKIAREKLKKLIKNDHQEGHK